MKKFFSILLLILFILSFSACSKDKTDIKLLEEITAYNTYKIYSYVKSNDKSDSIRIGLFNCINEQPEYLFDLEKERYFFASDKLYDWASDIVSIYDVSGVQPILYKEISLAEYYRDVPASEYTIEKLAIKKILYCDDQYVYIETINTDHYDTKSYYAFAVNNTEYHQIALSDIPYNLYSLNESDYLDIYRQISDCVSAYDDIIGVKEFCAHITHNGQIEFIDLTLYVLNDRIDYDYYFDRVNIELYLTNKEYIIKGLDDYVAGSNDQCDRLLVRSDNPYKDWCPLSLQELFNDLLSMTNRKAINICSEAPAQYYTVFNSQTSNADSVFLTLRDDTNKINFKNYLIAESSVQQIQEKKVYESESYYTIAPLCLPEDVDDTEKAVDVDDYVVYNPFRIVVEK